DGDAVVGEEPVQEAGVPLFFVRLHRDRLAHERVALGVRHRAHTRTGGALARHRFAPERQRLQPREVVGVEHRPLDVARLVRAEGVGELPTEEPLVLLATNPQFWHTSARWRARAIYRNAPPRAKPRGGEVSAIVRIGLACLLAALAGCGGSEP